ncbi:MAG: hypothetical protein HN377_04540 [Alphaproteobacteria bacterium]|jgi:hypothetical protein|nr:hypothetical protein [Alphaproteobacteria bacterium]MBT7943554.1 hypothetical protein [Alphaproteobacteria bacterium]
MLNTDIKNFVSRNRLSILSVLGVLGFANVAWVTVSYLIYPGYLDHGESNMTLMSWRLLGGHPAYLGFDNPNLVSNVYGPLTYASHALSYWFFGPAIISGKVMSFLAALLIPIVVFFSHRSKGGALAAIGAIFAIALILFQIPFSIWTRPESLMALMGAVAVWAANASRPDRPEWGKSLVIALAASLAVGMKLHAGLYFAPVVLFHCVNDNRGLKTFAFMAVVGSIVVLLPFAFSVFPIEDFWAWIFHHIKKESPSSFVFKYIRYGAIYAAPALFFLAAWRWSNKGEKVARAESVYFWVFMACLILALFPATKVGAGTYYFYPFMAVLVDQVLRHARRVETRKAAVWSLLGVYILTLLIISVPAQKRFFRALHWQEVAGVQTEIRSVMAAYKGRTIEMGIGSNIQNYSHTFYRTLLVLAGHPYTYDPAPAMEMNMWKLPLPDETLSMLRRCDTDIWLIPKGEDPFMMNGYYGPPAVDKVIPEIFQSSYKKLETLKFFDVWACKQ